MSFSMRLLVQAYLEIYIISTTFLFAETGDGLWWQWLAGVGLLLWDSVAGTF
jgi:hypothetical protein